MSNLRNIGSGMALLAVLASVAVPALADTQFQARKMTRDDVPLGKGQCDIRLRIDGEAEVSVRGDTVFIRTVSGRDGRDDGSECNEPLPIRPVQDFGFEVRDRRNDIALLSEPARVNGFRAVVRIRDTDNGEGRYHFRLTWQMDGGGVRPMTPPGGISDRREDPPYGYGDNRGRGNAYGRRRGGVRLGDAVNTCADAVAARVVRDYGFGEVTLDSARVDSPAGREEYLVTGDATAWQGNSASLFAFTCRVEDASGRVQTVDVRRR